MSAAAFRLLCFVALAAGSAALWVGFLHTGGGEVGSVPAIPPVASQSIFAPTTDRPATLGQALGKGLSVRGLVTAPACGSCTLHLGSGGLVRARVGSGATQRKAYALLDLGDRRDGNVVARDVIALGRGEQPVGPVRVSQLLDSSHRVIFELVATPDRKLHLVSPAGGVRGTALSLPVGAVVPNDGVSGVAVEVAMQKGKSLSVYVNGVRTASVSDLTGATTATPRYFATGVIQYTAPADAPPITAVHTQVSVSTPAPQQPAPAPQPLQQSASQPTEAPPVPPANSAPPTVNGTGLIGSTLTADPGTWSDTAATFTYAWQRCDAAGTCTPIDGATDSSYKLAAADRDALVRVRVTATGAGGTASKATAAVGPVLPTVPASLTAPTVSGDATVGSTLTATLGTWDDSLAKLVLEWRRCDSAGNCTTIDGASGLTYTLTGADVGYAIRVRVTATNEGGSTTAHSAPTAPVAEPVPVPPAVNGAPYVTGDAAVGSTLSANPGSWTDPSATFAYVWQRCDASGSCSAIAGATGGTYAPTSVDAGQLLRVEVTATGANGASATADSATVGPVKVAAPSATKAPSVAGTPTVGSTLTGDGGAWTDTSATFSYQWQRCDASGACSAISGATAGSYTVTSGDVGSQIRLEVTAVNAGGTGVADSVAVGPIAQTAPVSTGAPSVGGDATVGSTLTASPGTWSDPSATIAYQWQRCDSTGACTAIDGATSATYSPTSADAGQTLRVVVTATNAGGSGVADSPAVGPVTQAPPAPPTGTTSTQTTSTQTAPAQAAPAQTAPTGTTPAPATNSGASGSSQGDQNGNGGNGNSNGGGSGNGG